MFCPNCGREMSDGARFCPGCGKETDTTSSQEPVVPEKKRIKPAVVVVLCAVVAALVLVGGAFGLGVVKLPGQKDPLVGSWTVRANGIDVSVKVNEDGTFDTGDFQGKLLGVSGAEASDMLSWDFKGEQNGLRVYDVTAEVVGMSPSPVITLKVPSSFVHDDVRGTWSVSFANLGDLGMDMDTDSLLVSCTFSDGGTGNIEMGMNGMSGSVPITWSDSKPASGAGVNVTCDQLGSCTVTRETAQ